MKEPAGGRSPGHVVAVLLAAAVPPSWPTGGGDAAPPDEPALRQAFLGGPLAGLPAPCGMPSPFPEIRPAWSEAHPALPRNC
ncbi:MAG: hypothetical protein IPJ99_00715 [Betaproteobacteria bacterium]|nr:hypothetical protein [Betaproteobacteria bacterium]